MAEILTHAFISPKADSPDPSLVSASEWNDGHAFLGGSNGQMLVFDNTQPKNMRWVDGIRLYTASLSPASSVVPVIVPLTTLILNSRNVVTWSMYLSFIESTISAGFVQFEDNGVVVNTLQVLAPATTTVVTTFAFSYSANAGSHALRTIINTYTAGVTLSSMGLNTSIVYQGAV